MHNYTIAIKQLFQIIYYFSGFYLFLLLTFMCYVPVFKAFCVLIKMCLVGKCAKFLIFCCFGVSCLNFGKNFTLT